MMNQSLTMMMRMMRSLSDTMLNLGGYLQEKAGDLLLLNSSELDLFKQDMATRSMLSSLVSLLQVKKLRLQEGHHRSKDSVHKILFQPMLVVIETSIVTVHILKLTAALNVLLLKRPLA